VCPNVERVHGHDSMARAAGNSRNGRGARLPPGLYRTLRPVRHNGDVCDESV
jgi:hypothetical protein